MDISKIERLAREILAELGNGAAPLETRTTPTHAPAAPARPAGGDGWQKGKCTWWSSEMKDGPRGPSLRGRIGLTWIEDGQQQKAFYSVFDSDLTAQLERMDLKGQDVRVRLQPWKDTHIVADLTRGGA